MHANIFIEKWWYVCRLRKVSLSMPRTVPSVRPIFHVGPNYFLCWICEAKALCSQAVCINGVQRCEVVSFAMVKTFVNVQVLQCLIAVLFCCINYATGANCVPNWHVQTLIHQSACLFFVVGLILYTDVWIHLMPLSILIGAVKVFARIQSECIANPMRMPKTSVYAFSGRRPCRRCLASLLACEFLG